MTIYLCADDIGQDPAINEGCLELFDLGRLNQVSVLALAPHLRSHQQALLQAHKNGLQMGLHFNLTLPFPNALMVEPLTRLIYLSHLRLLNKKLVRDSFVQQINTFLDLFGVLPDFIDGHQHVHQFPQIRDVLLECLTDFYKNLSTLMVRSTVLPDLHPNLPYPMKCHLLNILGGNHFLEELDQHLIPHNHGFLGVYDFQAPTLAHYRSLMQRWLVLANDQSMIMCHPANQVVNNDAIGLQRPIEFDYLKSDMFLSDLHSAKKVIERHFK